MNGDTLSKIAIDLNLRITTVRNIVKEIQSITQCKSLYTLVITGVRYGWHFLMRDDLVYQKN